MSHFCCILNAACQSSAESWTEKEVQPAWQPIWTFGETGKSKKTQFCHETRKRFMAWHIIKGYKFSAKPLPDPWGFRRDFAVELAYRASLLMRPHTSLSRQKHTACTQRTKIVPKKHPSRVLSHAGVMWDCKVPCHRTVHESFVSAST